MSQEKWRLEQSREKRDGMVVEEMTEIMQKYGLSTRELADIVSGMVSQEQQDQHDLPERETGGLVGAKKEAGEPKIENYKNLLSYARDSLARVKQELNSREGSALYVVEDHLCSLNRLIEDSNSFLRDVERGERKLEFSVQRYWLKIIRLKLIFEAFFLQSPYVRTVFNEEDWSKILSLHKTFERITRKMDNYFRDYLGVEFDDKVELFKKVPEGAKTMAAGDDHLTTLVSGLATKSPNLGKRMSKTASDAFEKAGGGRAGMIIDIQTIGYRKSGQQVEETVFGVYHPSCRIYSKKRIFSKITCLKCQTIF
ncbi:hypothetical protein A2316_04185 [Candidatus Falkowbacteria bacterium RIFOXYB2_FULL_38_15]|uniref:Uncharacterized protein n=1 Tax=Candidatus Falkowbacteria bacterium RIFOXYA2_FULL_38_12 TaxID=1797993 RepID=A0A1F5S268_9BACT|nr:MAG: hypothetical protein A2257_03330 [Candidatus Falkowbacteria bacterium RIFOXYA2_FULL_38_12]OGF33684.1 MAG: hypothetical protein A2316_04185 [Candidatus Falkowbacteria bacterium RIFOXYB2_FULL_38_15]OGF42045.1 MAG: hypothetical protein A2555_01445 [Candidatus Falkowbacteria bacterium RIFOXYD2_FULL_39_16]